MCRPSRSIAAGGVLALLVVAPLGAQGIAAPSVVPGVPDTSTPPASHQATGPLFTTTHAWIAGGTVLGAATLMLVDRTITDEVARDAGMRDNRFLRHLAADFDFLGDPGTAIISVGLYGVGRLAHRERVAELGLRGAEALVLSAAATEAIKGIAGRARPYLNDSDPDNFALGRGFTHGGYSSFPSGHATAAFAVATVVAAEGSRWWPDRTWIIAPLVYGGATLVAWARVYGEKHWASDVLAGAGIGTLSGLLVVRYHVLHPHTRLDRWLLPEQVGPDGRGSFRIGWRASWQLGAP
jgi:membrane-associated phospholipid phosphatase